MPCQVKNVDVSHLKEMREKNNRKIQELCGLNEQLEKNFAQIISNSDVKKQMKAATTISKKYEKRIQELQLELDSQMAFQEKHRLETEKLEELSRRNLELQQQSETMEQQLIDPITLKYQSKLSKKQHKMLKKNNKLLKEQVKRLTEELSYQTKVGKSYQKAEESLEELEKTEVDLRQKIQDLKQNLEPWICTRFATLKKEKQDKMEKQITSIMKEIKVMKKELDYFEPYFRKDQEKMSYLKAVNQENEIPVQSTEGETHQRTHSKDAKHIKDSEDKDCEDKPEMAQIKGKLEEGISHDQKMMKILQVLESQENLSEKELKEQCESKVYKTDQQTRPEDAKDIETDSEEDSEDELELAQLKREIDEEISRALQTMTILKEILGLQNMSEKELQELCGSKVSEKRQQTQPEDAKDIETDSEEDSEDELDLAKLKMENSSDSHLMKMLELLELKENMYQKELELRESEVGKKHKQIQPEDAKDENPEDEDHSKESYQTNREDSGSISSPTMTERHPEEKKVTDPNLPSPHSVKEPEPTEGQQSVKMSDQMNSGDEGGSFIQRLYRSIF